MLYLRQVKIFFLYFAYLFNQTSLKMRWVFVLWSIATGACFGLWHYDHIEPYEIFLISIMSIPMSVVLSFVVADAFSEMIQAVKRSYTTFKHEVYYKEFHIMKKDDLE